MKNVVIWATELASEKYPTPVFKGACVGCWWQAQSGVGLGPGIVNADMAASFHFKLKSMVEHKRFHARLRLLKGQHT